jgi:hypothetical protein
MLPADVPPAPPGFELAPSATVITHERVGVSDGATMGMAGLHARWPVGRPAAGGGGGGDGEGLEVGLSLFGATQGDRGGFFAWGATAAHRWRFGDWAAEAGAFVGGGGGSPGWVGGGLMLRPHVELSRRLGPVALGLGASHVRFPDGRVSSGQWTVSLRWAGVATVQAGEARAVEFAPADAGTLAAAALGTQWVALGGLYSFRNDSVRRDGGPVVADLRYGGFAVRREGGGGRPGWRPYTVLSAAGSITGAYSGYAEALAGLGVAGVLPVAPALAWRAEAMVGSGGGGAAADTGGGLIAKLGGGLTWRIAGPVSLGFVIGRIESRGPLRGEEARLELGFHGFDVVPGARGTPALPPGSPGSPRAIVATPWALATGFVQYGALARDDGREQALGAFTVRLERPFANGWRLVGHALTAMTGDAGGYASGHLGAGWMGPAFGADGGWRVGAEATLGAAGGGGVAVGNGLFAQAQVSVQRRVAPGWALRLEGGVLRGRAAGFDAPFVGLGLVREIGRLEGR